MASALQDIRRDTEGMRNRRYATGFAAIAVTAGLAITPAVHAAPSGTGVDARSVTAHWTAARMAAAIPRDIVTDASGHWYIGGPGGALVAYGAGAAASPVPAKGKPGGSTVGSADWTKGGTVKEVAGRLYFVMDGIGYVCSGTTATDENSSLSVILTAAHCVYDDVNKAFASDVLFIPDLAASGTHTDSTCNTAYVNGCWVPDYGVIASDWSSRVWPSNIPYDYGFYVVPNVGSHRVGNTTDNDPLDGLGSLSIAWNADSATVGMLTDALGYSYKVDPRFMYCEQALGSIYGVAGYLNHWLSGCRLSGGSSGGPWMAAAAVGEGPIISVNSWGYQGKPGMAGPRLQAAEPRCVYDAAVVTRTSVSGGYEASCA